MEENLARERVRSPNYPVFGLATAIERAATLYKRDGKAAIHVAAAVKAWGYNSLNGRSLGVIGALRQYGLLDDAGAPKMVRLSPLALTIQLSPGDSAERRRAIAEAAGRPKIFNDLLAQYPDGFPSDATMVGNLALSTNFSEEAAARVIAAFRETIDLLEQVQAVNTSRESAREQDERGDEPQTPPPKPPKKEGEMPSVITAESDDLNLPLGGGRRAILRVPQPLSENEYQRILKMIAAMKEGFVSGTSSSNETSPQ